MRAKSAVAAAASENVKNFKIYRWDPNEKVGTGACSFISVPVVGCLLLCVGSICIVPVQSCSLTQETAAVAYCV